MKKQKSEILVLFGKGATPHILAVQKELELLGEPATFSNYKDVRFQVGEGGSAKILLGKTNLSQFKVIFFRTTGKKWEEVNLILSYLKERVEKKLVRIVDPVILGGRPYLSMKAHQMFVFHQAGLPVPRTIYGSLKFIKEEVGRVIGFPAVVKRSEGGRGQRVYLAKDQPRLNYLIEELKSQEKEEGKRFLVQEFIANKGDLRILVLGNQILGAIKRVRAKKGEFRNNVSLGGKVYPSKLDKKIKQIALRAAKIAQLSVAGVDIVLRDPDQKPFIFEVNRAPQFKGFMRATGINVPLKLAEYLISLKEQTR